VPPRHSVTVDVDAPPKRVWAVVTDVEHMGRLSPECVGGQWLDGADGPVVGARFRGDNRRGEVAWSKTCEVVEVVPQRAFAFAVDGAARPSCTWRYELEPLRGGKATRVTESFELPKPLSRFRRFVAKASTGVADREADLVHGMERTLAAVKAAVER
jgi:uncharacterized protein YndB with AHSA1/START domain